MVKSVSVSMKEISFYLGHKSVNVTERVYQKYSANVMGFYFLKQVQITLPWK